MMSRRTKGLLWYMSRLVSFFWVSIRIFLFCLIRPKALFEILFTLYSDINDFHQECFKSLYPFEKTKVFKEIKENMIFPRCNFFVDLDLMRPVETQILATLTLYFKPKTILEIGTYSGHSALNFAHNSPEDCTIYTLDLPLDFDVSQMREYTFDDLKVAELSRKNIDRRVFKRVPRMAKKIVELFGDSKSFDFTPYHACIDLVFIDGCHDYAHVNSDTENAFRMLSDGGVLIWHDYDYIVHRSVFNYLNSLVKDQGYKIYFIKETRLAVYAKQLV